MHGAGAGVEGCAPWDQVPPVRCPNQVRVFPPGGGLYRSRNKGCEEGEEVYSYSY